MTDGYRHAHRVQVVVNEADKPIYYQHAVKMICTACMALGSIYDGGKGGEQCLKKAEEYYSEVASLGIQTDNVDADLCIKVGDINRKLMKSEHDSFSSMTTYWYKTAQKAGHPEADMRLADFFAYHGYDDRALKLSLQQAELGSISALTMLQHWRVNPYWVTCVVEPNSSWKERSQFSEKIESPRKGPWFYFNYLINACLLTANTHSHGYKKAESIISAVTLIAPLMDEASISEDTVQKMVEVASGYYQNKKYEAAFILFEFLFRRDLGDKKQISSCLGLMCLHGNGVEKNIGLGVNYFTTPYVIESFEEAHNEFALAMMFIKGEHVERNIKQAIRHLKSACEWESTPHPYSSTKYVEIDGDKVIEYGGISSAYYVLAKMYLEGSLQGHDVRADLSEFYTYFYHAVAYGEESVSEAALQLFFIYLESNNNYRASYAKKFLEDFGAQDNARNRSVSARLACINVTSFLAKAFKEGIGGALQSSDAAKIYDQKVSERWKNMPCDV